MAKWGGDVKLPCSVNTLPGLDRGLEYWCNPNLIALDLHL